MAYYPKSQITTNLYTNGGEFTRIDNNEIYRGYYWKNSSNKYYSGKTPNDTPSIELIESPKPKQLKPTDVTYTEGPAELNPSPEWLVNYRGLTKSSPGKLPQKSQTIPTNNDYELGEFQRYFTKKRNQNSYFEISKEDYTLLQTKNNKIQYQLYLPIILSWVISGDKNEVYNTNKNIVKLTEKRLKLPGFTQYFKDNFTQYRRFDIEENLETDGTEYRNKRTGQPYKGFYHINPERGPMVGATHKDQSHDFLVPIDEEYVQKQPKLPITGSQQPTITYSLPNSTLYPTKPRYIPPPPSPPTPPPSSTSFILQLNIPTDGFETILGLQQDGGDATWTINWGDGTTESGTGAPTRTWPSAGVYDVEIKSGGFNSYSQDYTGINDSIRATLVDVLNWGNTQWVTMASAFLACDNLTGFSAQDIPDTSQVTSLYRAFSFNDGFNYDISNWDVSNVKNFQETFLRATTFNQPLNSWDTSNATNMNSMFFNCLAFDQSLNSWDTSKVTSMTNMFMNCLIFNQPLNNWNVRKVVSFQNMFKSARKFNQDIGDWRMDEVFRIKDMFADALEFNNGGTDNIKNWTVGTCVVMQGTFNGANNFNQPIENWDVGSAINLKEMFKGGIFNQPLNGWDVRSVTSLFGTFNDCIFNQPLNNWVLDSLTNTRNCFKQNRVFNQDISNWDMSKVTTMDSMFYGAWVFNQDISGWNLPLVIDIDFMFYDTQSFNQPIGSWSMPLLNTCKAVFSGALLFNQPLDSWDMSNVTRTLEMFKNTDDFNQDLSNWDVSSVTDMSDMFHNATSFSQNLGAWNIEALSLATNMFIDTSMTPTDYDNLLIGWSTKTRILGAEFSNDLQFNFGVSGAAHSNLVNTPWTITDNGQVT